MLGVRIKLWSAVLVASVVAASSVEAQDRGRGGPFGGDDLSMALNPGVRGELDLLADQVEKLEALSAKRREDFGKLFSGMRDLSEDERRAKFESLRETMAQKMEESKKQIAEILLPHQSQRLAQIVRQQRLRAAPGGGLSIDVIASELKLSDAEKEKLKAKAEEVQKKLAENMTKLRKDAENDLLSVLTAEQADQWRKLVGESFEVPRPQFGGRRPGDSSR